MGFFGRSQKRSESHSKDLEKTSFDEPLSKADLKHATRTRFCTALFTSFCLLITVIFLIVVEVGNTYNSDGLTNIYFIRLNLSNVVPTSIANAVLLNSIAQTLGLHDYYQVGLWGYCEGYQSSGITSCTSPEALYWFNPVAIISDQLIAGATITLPNELNSILSLIEIASNWMFGLFLAGACLSFVLIFLLPLAVLSRWTACFLAIVSFLNALAITAASVIATAMFIIMKNVFANNQDVNITAKIGTTMFACMWVASAFAIFAWLLQTGMCCCCASRRDVRTGRKGRNKIAHHSNGKA